MPSHRFTSRARTLRANQTDSEGRLWGALRNRRLGGWKWRRQVPRGPYIVDFLCAEANLVIELDGSQHQDQQVYDRRRTAFLEELGLKVMRFECNAVFEALDGLCEEILAACGGEVPSRGETPHPTLSPQAGRGL